MTFYIEEKSNNMHNIWFRDIIKAHTR